MSDKDIEIVEVRRANDDSGWHIKFSIDGNVQPAWVTSEGYLDRDELKDMLADKIGFQRPQSAPLHRDVKFSNVLTRTGRRDARLSTPQSEPLSPPRTAELLFALLSPKKTADAQLGDLQELFEENSVRFGKSRARMLYWAQVLRAVGPNVWRLIRKWGLIGILIDYGRSKLGL